MIDLDELIAEARECHQARGWSKDPLVGKLETLSGRLADTLVSVRAERDDALARIAEAAKQLAEVLDQHDKDEAGATTAYLNPTERRLQVAVRALNRVDRITEALGLNEGENDRTLPIHRTEAGWHNCATCDGGGCHDCTDPA